MASFAEADRTPLAALVLGLAGLVPFAAAALSQYAGLPGLAPDCGVRLGIVYGAVILSFLGGIRWGVALRSGAPRRQAIEFAASVLPSLAGVTSVFLPEILGLGLLVSGFLMQALWDVMGVEDRRLSRWFGNLRMVLTAGAVIALIALLPRLLI